MDPQIDHHIKLVGMWVDCNSKGFQKKQNGVFFTGLTFTGVMTSFPQFFKKLFLIKNFTFSNWLHAFKGLDLVRVCVCAWVGICVCIQTACLH